MGTEGWRTGRATQCSLDEAELGPLLPPSPKQTTGNTALGPPGQKNEKEPEWDDFCWRPEG